MGNSCSSGQAHKDKDNASQHSEESPSYRITKPSIDSTAADPGAQAGCAADGGGGEQALLEPQSSLRDSRRSGAAARPPRHIGTSISDSISLSSPVTTQSPRSLEPPSVPEPPGVAALPEEQRAALAGRLAAPTHARHRRNKAIIIYVCAADSQDCSSEKGALQCGAALRLRARARRRGWRLHVADLHWRSPLEQQRDHRFPVLCTAELARQSELGAVVPVLFLNSGLGTPLLPHTLEAADFRAALEAAGNDDDRALLNKWYIIDSEAEPACYRLVRGAPARWRREMARALSVLVRTLPQEACDAYLTTVVEQEVHNTVLLSVEQARRCIWVCRAGGAGGAGDSTEATDAAGKQELQRRLTKLQHDLKQHLCERNIIRASLRGAPPGWSASAPSVQSTAGAAEYTEGVRAALVDRLEALIDALIAENDAPAGYQGVPASLFEELTEHLIFCQKTAQSTATRELTISEIKAYICGDSTVPLVLLGGAGCGKTTLVARAVQQAPVWLPDVAVLLRFVGLTATSGCSLLLLKSLVDQLHVLHDGSVYRGRFESGALTAELTRLLNDVSRSRPLLLVVAGADGLRGARWLPSTLPDNVKMILTVTEETDEPSSSAVLAVLTSERGPRVLRAPAPSAAEARAVLTTCAACYHRTGARPTQQAYDAVSNFPTPLYAKILAWQTSLSAETFAERSGEDDSAEPVSLSGEIRTEAGLEAALASVLEGAEAALGAERVRHVLALLCASRRGLDDTEILDLLAHSPLFRSEETYLPWAPASLFWPQLSALLGAWLHYDARGAARWRDAGLARAATERYLGDARVEREVRTTLVEYYEGAWYEENDQKMAGRVMSQENKFSEECYNLRKLDELPYQHWQLSRADPEWFSRRPYFSELSWVQAKLAAAGCGRFLHDASLLRLEPPPEHIALLVRMLEQHSFALDYDSRQMYGILGAILERRIADGEELQSDICRAWYEQTRAPPLPTLVPAAAGAGEGAGAAAGGAQLDLVVRLDPAGRYCATLATERQEICVWDIMAGRKVRTLLGVPHPTNLVPIDQHRCVVLCRRELRVYDLDKGQFVVALKGVMNQKMPYYGLHDASHVVTLSRNRMYVNLMNMETGDCVTTFKAGEDRFLNSLLVSGDGRILVCGDETQKPFPLLVWGLSSRKLLYDLRIPHHEFITALAAITHEGSYVCVGCRELDEPTANFIVVYDLQSGTLFKKWKPGVDCAALAISAADACVVCALVDARILVWDLLTGNCRLTLRGHTAAASVLRLAHAGAVLLSADAAARDRSVRLWDLASGDLISVYTPESPVRSCEVCCGGAHAALALAGARDLRVLALRSAPGAVLAAAEHAAPYGDAARDGLVVQLSESEQC